MKHYCAICGKHGGTVLPQLRDACKRAGIPMKRPFSAEIHPRCAKIAHRQLRDLAARHHAKQEAAGERA